MTKFMTNSMGATLIGAIARSQAAQNYFDLFEVGDVVGVDYSPAIGELKDERKVPRNLAKRRALRGKGFDEGNRTAVVIAKTPNFITIKYAEMPDGEYLAHRQSWTEAFTKREAYKFVMRVS